LDRTRRLSELILQRHPEAFSSDYEKNKKALFELAVIPSKQLRNHIAGYITKSLKEESAPDEGTEEETQGEATQE
jgi:small subunit ribosomal protein S17e